MKSVYIHIPFCKSICTYCDFSKLYYNKKIVLKYLEELRKEIKLNYKGEILKTIYIGGGTPTSLDIDELKYLFEIIKLFNLDNDIEFTIECNIENLTKEKLDLFKENKVNRLSIGVQTFNDKFLSYLNRNHKVEDVKNIINYAKEIGFDNINIDLIYALKNETLKDLENDLNEFLNLNINHISTYSLIIEPHTKLYIDLEENINEELDYEMYKLIDNTLSKCGYIHYEVSNYAKEGYESKHNLTYWNNDKYYGFGLGASGYIDNIRYTNTRNMNEYLKSKYRYSEEEISKKIDIENQMILGLRKMKGVNIKEFKEKYNCDIIDIYNLEELIKKGKLIKTDESIYINPEYIYTSNDILINFIGEE